MIQALPMAENKRGNGLGTILVAHGFRDQYKDAGGMAEVTLADGPIFLFVFALVRWQFLAI